MKTTGCAPWLQRRGVVADANSSTDTGLRMIAGWPAIIPLLLLTWMMPGRMCAGEPRPVSKYASTARAKAVSYKDESDVPAGGFRALFAGFGGYQLELLSGDERSWINIRFGRNTVDLYAATMEAAGGTFPNKANDVVEWRGVVEKGRFVPYAIIYRMQAGNDETGKTHTRLIVVKLDRERSAVIGQVSGADEDAEAKRMADRARILFLRGSDGLIFSATTIDRLPWCYPKLIAFAASGT